MHLNQAAILNLVVTQAEITSGICWTAEYGEPRAAERLRYEINWS